MEYYFTYNKMEILSPATTWMTPEDSMLSKIASHQKQILYDSNYYMRYLRVVRFIKKIEWWLPGDEDEGNGEYCSMSTEFQFCKMKEF